MMVNRQFANSVEPGDYAVPSFANPVYMDENLTSVRVDVQSGETNGTNAALQTLWESIWGYATGSNDGDVGDQSLNLSDEDKAAVEGAKSAGVGMGFILVLGFVIYFLKKGGL